MHATALLNKSSSFKGIAYWRIPPDLFMSHTRITHGWKHWNDSQSYFCNVNRMEFTTFSMLSYENTAMDSIAPLLSNKCRYERAGLVQCNIACMVRQVCTITIEVEGEWDVSILRIECMDETLTQARWACLLLGSRLAEAVWPNPLHEVTIALKNVSWMVRHWLKQNTWTWSRDLVLCRADSASTTVPQLRVGG